MKRELIARTESEVLELVAAGESTTAACRVAGLSERWAYERANRLPDFRARLAEAREAGRQARQERVTSLAHSILDDIVEKPRTTDDGQPLRDEDGELIWELDLTDLQQKVLLKLLSERPASSVNVGVQVNQRDAPSVVQTVPSTESATEKARRLLGEIEDAQIVE